MAAKPAQGSFGVGDRRGDWLVDLMGNRGRQLPHRRDAIGVRERHLRIAVPPLARAQVFLRLLALGQIEHEGDALVPAVAEGRRADKNRHTRAVFAKVLLLVRFAASRHHELLPRTSDSVAPFAGRQGCPVHAIRNEIVAAVSHDLEKGFVRLNNAAFKIPDGDPDDIGIDQPPDLRLTLLQIAVETGVLQRDRRLRREQLEDRDSIRGERV